MGECRKIRIAWIKRDHLFKRCRIFLSGFGDFLPRSYIEEMMAAATMLLGLLLYGYALAYLAATLANLDVARVSFLTRIVAMKDFMKVRGITEDLKISVSDN